MARLGFAGTLALAAVAAASCTPSPTPAPSLGASLAATSPTAPLTPSPSPSGLAASPSPSALAAPSIECHEDRATKPRALAGTECPAAIAAALAVGAPLAANLRRVVIEPGPFYCDDVWPGVGSPPICYGTFVIPGQYMHGWISFIGDDRVAAVMLGRDLPADLDRPLPSPPPWHATLARFEIPPAGWQMP